MLQVVQLLTHGRQEPTNSFNSLWPSDAIRRQGSRSTLVQVMACCLMAPSHYLNQCWQIISEVQWHSYQGDFTSDASTISHRNPFENYLSKILSKSPRGQWVKVNTMTKMAWWSKQHGHQDAWYWLLPGIMWVHVFLSWNPRMWHQSISSQTWHENYMAVKFININQKLDYEIALWLKIDIALG